MNIRIAIVSMAAVLLAAVSHAQETKTADWQLSLLGGGFSEHLSTDYEPAGGYEEFHEAIGLHVEKAGDGWVYGAMALRFVDSYDEGSFLAGATLKYNKTFENEISIFGGAAAGYVDTSYYSGAVAMPMVGLGYKRVSLNVSYLPAMDDSDELLMGLISVKLFEW
jgi:hypothetical protein